jgi:hypothetical protein
MTTYPSEEAVVFTGRVRGGKIRVRAWRPVRMPDGEVTITVERARARRSNEANSLYWAGYVAPLADYTGLTPLTMHAYLKQRFLPRQQIEIVDKSTGATIDETEIAALTTTKLTPTEFSDYLREIGDFAETLRVAVGSNREAA